ncbi:MAG: NAD(P)H-dependent oxidoreductase [Alphaproteobacteria bacterium]|nr:NAD(P)H-dependent oxidoreductase [Alphaproteobacteria bacterium]MCW5741312.1 NAD(P)H-dependent oxidoreductase [Alphaproteobacteria bacterium]
MARLLYVVGSPRGATSRSNTVAAAYVEAFRAHHPDFTIDTLDLWREELPVFDDQMVAAKLAVMRQGRPDDAQRAAWQSVLAVVERFRGAERYVFSVPMWNGSIPYRLKHYIDVIMQPGLLFNLDRAQGYSGLLRDKRATVVYSAGIYAPGKPPQFGADFQVSYFDWWLHEAGITDIDTIRLPPLASAGDVSEALARASDEARALAVR